MRKDKSTLDDRLKRVQELAGIKPNYESKKGTLSTVKYTTIGADGKTYGIVQEGGIFFIKNTTEQVINESTLNYINGLVNKTDYKYKSYPEALRNLNFMMIDLNESVIERLDKDLGVDEEVPEQEAPVDSNPPVEAEPQSEPATEPEVNPEIPNEPVNTETPAPEQEAPVNNDGLADDDSDLEDPADGGNESIDHYVGKLTSIIRNTGEEDMSEDRMKSIMNSIISALPLNRMSPEERLILARRVKRGGSKGADEVKEQQIVIPISEMFGLTSKDEIKEAILGSDLSPEEKVQKIISILNKLKETTSSKLSGFEKDPYGSNALSLGKGYIQGIEVSIETINDYFDHPEQKPEFNEQDDIKINEFFSKLNKSKLISENNTLKYNNMIVESTDNKIIISKGDTKHDYLVSEGTLTTFKNLVTDTKALNENESYLKNLIKEVINKK